MKYEIQKSKLDDIMYKYIVDMFENDEHGELNYNYFYDEYGNELDWTIDFYFGDYGDEYSAFYWETDKIYEYWGDIGTCDECPKIKINQELKEKLDGMFNNLWKPMFKKWLKENYDLEPKTIQ